MENYRKDILTNMEVDMRIKTLALSRILPNGVKQYLICNGMAMGRWTQYFGAPCLADLQDNIAFLKNIYQNPNEQHIETHVIEEYDIVRLK